MTESNLFRRLRGAFKIAVVWGVGWFVGAFIVSNALRFLGVVPASLTWVDSLGMAIKIGMVGGIAGGAFSTLIAFLYRGKRLKEINWVRFGILGGIATGIFIPGMMETLSILSGGGVVPLNLIFDDLVITTVFGAILAGGSMKLAQDAERGNRGSIGDPDQMEWLGSGEVLGDQLTKDEVRVKKKAG